MASRGKKVFVGFGFGAIQAGLFLYEAFQSGSFEALYVAEVVPEVVEAVRRAKGHFSVNIAHPDRIEPARVGPIGIEQPTVPSDRSRLVEKLAEAHEIATAVPSVDYYVSPGESSLHRVLARGLQLKIQQGGPKAVVYAAENHNRAAELLEEAVLAEIPDGDRDRVRDRVRFLNTVIGKMSGVVSDPARIREGLSTITPEGGRAFLVEEFNRILISRVDFTDGFDRGITVFEEKDRLLPFEEAKLYGHNATHALGAYLGALAGVDKIGDLKDLPGVIEFMRKAFLEESGEALIRKNKGVDPLFTPAGYREYADDLLTRMTNPFLGDTVERVGRDPARKLGWSDRLVGTIRVALQEGVVARRYAAGVAAGLLGAGPELLDGGSPVERLEEFWKGAEVSPAESSQVRELVGEGIALIRRWRHAGFCHLENLFGQQHQAAR